MTVKSPEKKKIRLQCLFVIHCKHSFQPLCIVSTDLCKHYLSYRYIRLTQVPPSYVECCQIDRQTLENIDGQKQNDLCP